jgi:uncharacterized protein (UPF0179 family)
VGHRQVVVKVQEMIQKCIIQEEVIDEVILVELQNEQLTNPEQV